MKVDCLIIGQGICGTFLSWYLDKAGLQFAVIDEAINGTASKSAAGIINPVTGRRIVKTWIIDELLPFALEAYDQLEKELGISCINKKDIIDFFPTPQMRIAFQERLKEDGQFLQMPKEENDWRAYFHYDFGFGEIHSSYLVDLNKLLSAYRKRLEERQQLIAEKFMLNDLVIKEKEIHYKEIQADQIIFCDGISSINNPYFSLLPFAPNKGEALIVKIEGLPHGNIFKRGISLAPWNKDLFWVGSSYEWNFEDGLPTEGFRNKTAAALKTWLKVPFEIVDHLVSIRPATLERRPFAGFHPLQKNLGILNGMGTKGCTLAPYFARQLVGRIKGESDIFPEADILRFANILARSFFSH